LGKWTARELVRMGKCVRMINRRGKASGLPADVEVVASDAYDLRCNTELTKNAVAVYQCAQPNYHEWAEKFPPLQNAILEAAAKNGAKLIVGDNLLGVLDVQSRETNAFSPALVQVLQTVADQLSVAIENAQLFQHAQASLAEVSSLYQQVIGGGWQQLAGGQARELVYNLASQAEAPGSGAADQSFSLEIRLRGQVIGTMQLYGRSESDLADDERVILETVAAQLGVALEGAVLFEESQRRTRREKLINQIADQMRATLNQTSVMQNGIRELGRALGASEVVVRLTPAGARRLDASEGKEE